LEAQRTAVLKSMEDSRADAIESCRVADDLQNLLDLEDGPLMQEIRAIYEANRLERKVRMYSSFERHGKTQARSKFDW
jgi:hypothetical protein